MALSEHEIELVGVRQEVQTVEKQITDQFQLFEKRESIPYAFNEDFSQRYVTVTIYFDQFNLVNMDTIMARLKELIILHRSLRQKEESIANRVREQKVIEKQMLEGVIRND